MQPPCNAEGAAEHGPSVTRWECGLLLLILTVMAAVLIRQAWTFGVTVDEPSHLLSAHLYWRGEDRLKPRDMPPLIKIAGGWPSIVLGIPVPYERPSWLGQHEWHIANDMIDLMKAGIQRTFFWCRLPLIIFPLATAALLWWGRRLFSPPVGLLLAYAFALEPTALGHGALFKNDHAATFAYLLFWFRAWKFWTIPRLMNAVWLGLALLTALLAKMSLLILIPLAPAIILLRPGKLSIRALAMAVLVLTIAYAGVLSAYQWEFRRISEVELEALARDRDVPAVFLPAAQIFRWLPASSAMWDGAISLMHSSGSPGPIYLLGNIYPNGSLWYFPLALAVKVPRALQVLVILGAVQALLEFRRRGFPPTFLFWLLPPILYIGLASLSGLQLGIRLILPALPFGLLVAGTAIDWLARHRPIVVAVLFLLLTWSVVRVYPYPIAYFNTWADGPDNGIRYLSDSNLDWGQDLPALATLVRNARIGKLKLSYFGTDSPWRFFSDTQLALVPPPWTPELVSGPELTPSPGYYAVSATLLPGHFFAPEYRNYFRFFRERRPFAKAGYSIFLYHISASDVLHTQRARNTASRDGLELLKR